MCLHILMYKFTCQYSSLFRLEMAMSRFQRFHLRVCTLLYFVLITNISQKKLCINLVQLGIVEDDKKIDTYVHLLLKLLPIPFKKQKLYKKACVKLPACQNSLCLISIGSEFFTSNLTPELIWLNVKKGMQKKDRSDSDLENV